MVRNITKVIESTTSPEQLDAQWIDISTEPAVLKAYSEGEWKPISGKTPTSYVKTVNNITPDSNGNVSINIPEVVNDTTTGGTTKAFSAEQGKALNTSLTSLQSEIDSFIGAQTNFIGIVASTSALPTVTSPSWGLVGSDIDALNAYVFNGTSWTQFGTKTYDFTDFSGLVNKMSVLHNTEEKGFHIADQYNNIGIRYNEEGLDVAKVSEHFLQLVGGGSVAGSVIGNTVEVGLYVVDQSLNVGVKVDKDGIHAPNILEYEIVES